MEIKFEHLATLILYEDDITLEEKEGIAEGTITKIQDLDDDPVFDWKHGDMISIDTFRDSGVYFINSDGTLIPNPDFSGSGYLTIPLYISKKFKNAYKAYEHYEYTHLELAYDDEFIQDTFGKFDSDFSFCIGKYDGFIDVSYPNDKENSFYFDEKLTKKSIIDWWEGSKLPQTSFEFSCYYGEDDYTEFGQKHLPENNGPYDIFPTWSIRAPRSWGGYH